MTIKEDILTLTEGIKHFKYSDRINVIIKKIRSAKTFENKEATLAMFGKLRDLFYKIEKDYATAKDDKEKERAKQNYDIAKVKYMNELKRVNSFEFKKKLAAAGVFTAVAVLTGIILRSNLHILEKQPVFVDKVENTFKGISSELHRLGDKAKQVDYDKRWKEIVDKSAKSTKEVIDKINNDPGFNNAKNTIAQNAKDTVKFYRGL